MRCTYRLNLRLLLGTAALCIALPAAAQNPGWTVEVSRYSSSMSLVADVEGSGEGDIVGAFVGNEIRGVHGRDASGVFFVALFANENGETMTFKMYDASLDAVVNLNETLVFEANKDVGTVSDPLPMTRFDPAVECPQGDPGWSVDPGAFPATMSLTGYASFDGREPAAGDRVAAFVGDDLRGIAGPTDVQGDMRFFLTIYGEDDGEALRFEGYDAVRDRVWTLTAAQALVFETNGVEGAPSDPVVWTADCSDAHTGVDGAVGRTGGLGMEVFPQPLRGAGQVRVSGLTAAAVHVALYDALGREVEALGQIAPQAREAALPIDASVLAPGLYLVRATDAAGRTATQAVVVQ